MNKSQRDPNQIMQYTHDEDQNAQRVTIVGGDFGIAQAVKDSLKDLKLELPKQPEFFPIEKEVIVKEYATLTVPQIIKEPQIIEVPKIVYETKIIEIEKPIVTTEIKIVERQVIVKEVKNLDTMFKLFLLGQTISTLIYLIGLFYK